MKKFIMFFCFASLCFPITILADPPEVSICDIQQGIGVNIGDIVTITGICTLPSDRLGNVITILTEPGGGPWCSITIFSNEELLIAEYGQCVRISGTVQEYYDKTELVIDEESIIEVWDCGDHIPDPIRVGEDPDLESLESCTVVLEGITVTEDPDQYGAQLVVDRYDNEWNILLRKTDDPLEVGDAFCGYIGFVDYVWAEYTVRLMDDTGFDERPHDNCPWMGTACDDVTIRQFITDPPAECFDTGDPLIHTVTWTNLCETRKAYLCVLMQVGTEYFFWPSWGIPLDFQIVNLPELGSYWESIFNFEWIDYSGPTIPITMWAAALDPDTLGLLGPIANIDFCVQ